MSTVREFFAAARVGNIEQVKQALDQGVDVEAKTRVRLIDYVMYHVQAARSSVSLPIQIYLNIVIITYNIMVYMSWNSLTSCYSLNLCCVMISIQQTVESWIMKTVEYL